MLLAWAYTDVNHRLIAPQALPPPANGFLKHGQIEHATPKHSTWPAPRLTEIIDPGPEELTGHVLVIAHHQPGVVTISVLTSVDKAVRIVLVICLVMLLLIVVADDVQHLRKTNGVRHAHIGQARCDRPCGVSLLNGLYQSGSVCDKILGRGIVGAIAPPKYRM